ncbi:Rieske (2Fe-2S) protein [Streptomyces orinoci]|uniref:Cytochrome bc1 complex Rieske iron-sulfur subunit n=1 Tax=Streptomyces orinoci TaxID=67339 RepID=A0ABV3JZU6_STRON|nr:Rieske (2Fe-2S) protein [Streptomyces orinoci]
MSVSPASGEREGATRRTMVLSTGAASLAALLAACGDSGGGQESKGSASATTAGPRPSATGGTASTAAPTDRAPASEAPSGADAVPAAQIPVGSGKVFADRKVVVTQPSQGEFKAFSAVCTHEGCVVGSVTGGVIKCPCHGSEFDIKDGSVRQGPARKPLPPHNVSQRGDSLLLE